MPVNPRLKKEWRLIQTHEYARLEQEDGNGVPDGGPFFYINGEVDLVAFRLSRYVFWYVPINNGLRILSPHDVKLIRRNKVETTLDQANDHNTCLFCCRYCDRWLRSTDDGYGTEHGWCGCEEPTREAS